MINIAFSKLVKIEGRQWEVNFRKLPSASYEFHADTATLEGDRLQFHVLRQGTSGWQVCGRDLPHWFCEASDKLGNAIENGLKEFYPGIHMSEQNNQVA
jgi:hypothetical protein